MAVRAGDTISRAGSMAGSKAESMAEFKAEFEAGFKQIGVVEGFYGRVWTEEERWRFIETLSPFGLNTYLYCPKHEPALAAEVMRPLSGEEIGRVGALAAFCGERGIALWAGLHLEPPLNISDEAHIKAVARKCLALWKLGVSGFCVQFDDLSCAFDPASAYGNSLAALQGHGVSALFEWARGLGVEGEWLVVPALYSQDPVLENTYGPYEPAYLSLLDARMPAEVGWMYTGPRVCSPAVRVEDVLDWRKGSRRPVVLWDNYPVNDAAMVNNLHLSPLTGRDPELPSAVRGYLFNPLLQPDLGAVPGATCLAYASNPRAYDPIKAWEAALEAALPEAARQPFRELEVLTRRCCLETYPTDGTFGGQGPLATRLAQSWQAMVDGRGGDSAANNELLDLLEALEAFLPAPMRGQAAPWLERLRQARTVFAARADAADWRTAASSYQKGEAWVLGEWFSP